MEQVLTADSLNDLRRRVLNDEEYTIDELANAVRTLVGERVAAAQETSKASKKRPAKKISLDDLL